MAFNFGRADFALSDLEGEFKDDNLPMDLLNALDSALLAWGAPTAKNMQANLSTWRGFSPKERMDNLDILGQAFLTQKGEISRLNNISKNTPNYENIATDLQTALNDWQGKIGFFHILKDYCEIMGLAADFARDFSEAKSQRGLMDFDDLISQTAALLNQDYMADWVRYKMNRQFDHILIDELQDTNRQQWDIINALIDDYFAGQSAQQGKARTFFTVGDFKQAIYGFQGTDPKVYLDAVGGIEKKARDAQQNFDNLPLQTSYRCASDILQGVDKVFTSMGGAAMGMGDDILPEHKGQDRPGRIYLWPVTFGEIGLDGEDDEGVAKAAETLANDIAVQVKQWIDPHSDNRLWLPSKKRWAHAGDVMILVQKRSNISQSLVARLYYHQINVAGIDRLRIGQPLAVKDMLSAMRFAVQPHDDLELASLLVSPICGWTQEELLQYGWRDKDHRHLSLWDFLRGKAKDDDELAEKLAIAGQILNSADYDTPYVFLENILSGDIDGRAKILSRLGEEALDTVQELLTIAQDFQQDNLPQLQQFIHWFDGNDEELKRQLHDKKDTVRVLTVHGSKGLEAPIVILADCCRSDGDKGEMMDWQAAENLTLPIYAMRKDDRFGRIEAAHHELKIAQSQENLRLLYVAMTRAEDQLHIAGFLGAKAKQVPEDCWYEMIARALFSGRIEEIAEERALVKETVKALGGQESLDLSALGVSTKTLTFGSEHWPVGEAGGDFGKTSQGEAADEALPQWLMQKAPPEARPPKPLAPSRIDDEESASPPIFVRDSQQEGRHTLSPARRGVIIHSLFERITELPEDQREAAANQWMERQCDIAQADLRAEIWRQVETVLQMEQWRHVFGEHARAEVSVAALVGHDVVAGIIDRLYIGDDKIQIIDFKTSRNPPKNMADIPRSIIRQMAAYGAAIRKIFPDHQVEAALLYTANAQMLTISADMLETEMRNIGV